MGRINLNKRLLLIIIIMMSVIGLLSTDIYLPSLPQITRYFNTSEHNVQITIGLFLFGLSVSQIIYGPLSEKYGRKSVLVTGMVIFILSSLCCLFSNSIEMLYTSRLFQGIGACAGMTIGRSIIGDVYSKNEAAKIFATVFPFVGLSPAIAPVIGGYLDTLFGWKSIFVTILSLGLVLLFLIIKYLPETMNFNNTMSIHPKVILKNYIYLLKNKIFIGYVLIPCIAYIAYFGYLTESPFIFYKHGLNASAIGMCYISLSISYVAGNFTSRSLLKYLSINQSLTIGYMIFTLSGVLMLLSTCYNFSFILFIFPITLLTFANGFLIPLGSAGVITNFSHISGYASGLLGFMQLGSAALSSIVIGKLTHGNNIFLSYYLFIITISGLILFYILILKGTIRVKNIYQKTNV